MNCKLCNQITNKIFNHLVLNKYDVEYFYCESCKFIQTENPYWLNETYQNPIASIDTGIINLLFTKNFNYYTFYFKNKIFGLWWWLWHICKNDA